MRMADRYLGRLMGLLRMYGRSAGWARGDRGNPT
jgi:hypothetical protein